MTNELFTDLNPTETQDINGGWFFGVSYSGNSSTTYNYQKSFNQYEYRGNYNVTALNEISVGNNNSLKVFSS